MLTPVLTFAFILSCALVVQNTLGFGLALFAIPLLLATDHSLYFAVFAVCALSAGQGALGAFRLRKAVPWSWCLKATLGRLAGLFPGLALASALSTTGRGWSELLVAGALTVGIAAQLYRQHRTAPEARETGSQRSVWTAALAFVSSGFLMGSVGMGGPPLVFWLLNGRWSPVERKAFLFGLFALTSPIQLAAMTAREPELAAAAPMTLLLSLPDVAQFASASRGLGEKWSQERLGKLTLLLLAALAVQTLCGIDYGALIAEG